MKADLKKIIFILLNATIDPVNELDMTREEIDDFNTWRNELLQKYMGALGWLND